MAQSARIEFLQCAYLRCFLVKRGQLLESNAPRQLLSVFLVACAFLSYPAVAHGPLICLRNTQGESLRLIGISHYEDVEQTSEADILQVRGDAKQVLFEVDPEKDKIFDCAKRMIKTGDWSLVGQNLTEETKARLIKFLSPTADILDKPNVNGTIFWVIYAKGMSRAGATFPPPKMENFLALEKTIKSEFVKSKLPVNEIEGCESYSKTMQDFKVVDYDALINRAIDCAENSECIKNVPETILQTRDANFSNYDDAYRVYNLYPSLDTPTLDARNIIMHENIVRLSRNTSSTLVVVGMAHISGPSGLLKLLKGDGFEPIQCNGATESTYSEVFYSSGNLRIQAYLYKPDGNGPFPVVIYNHGSRDGRERASVPFQYVGKILTRAGYVVLVPERRGYGKSDGSMWRQEVGNDQSRLITRLQAETDDVLAAIDYLRTIRFADASRMGIMGWSFGGIVTMLAVSRSTAFLVAIDQAGGALAWDGNPDLRSALIAAAEKAMTPTLFMVAKNDRTTLSITTLAEVFKNRGVSHRMIIYEPFTPTQGTRAAAPGHAVFSAQGVSVWESDVVQFLGRYLGASALDKRDGAAAPKAQQ